jgi:hypothetical protein
MIHNDVSNINNRMWKIIALLKIKIFLFVVPSANEGNLVKLNWKAKNSIVFLL